MSQLLIDTANSLQMVVRVYSLKELLLSEYAHPHRHQYLQPEVAEQLTYEAENAQKNTSLSLQIQLVGTDEIDDQTLQTMVARHFAYRQRLELQKKKQALKQGYKDSIIAFAFMLLMTFIYQMIESFMPESKLSNTIQDSLVILGWVAFWRPAELLLYEWHPHKFQASLYERLAAMQVQVVRLPAEN